MTEQEVIDWLISKGFKPVRVWAALDDFIDYELNNVSVSLSYAVFIYCDSMTVEIPYNECTPDRLKEYIAKAML